MPEENVLKKLLKFWFRQKPDGGLEAKLGYRFREPELLVQALVHRSFLTGKDLPYTENNERLEFLGDSVLNMLTTEFLYKTYPDDPEGELSKRKSAIVSGHACAQSSKEWDLSEYIKLGKAEAKMGGRGKESILADAYEAVLAILVGKVADYVETNPDLRSQPTEDFWECFDEKEDREEEEEEDW